MRYNVTTTILYICGGVCETTVRKDSTVLLRQYYYFINYYFEVVVQLQAKKLDHHFCNGYRQMVFQLLLSIVSLQEGWQAPLPVDLLTRLVDSMPRRLQAVIDSKGYPTKY